MHTGRDVTLIGNLTADPELRFTPNGKAVASFQLANTKRRLNSQTNSWEDVYTVFTEVNAWDALAENVAKSLTKGMSVIVMGELGMDTWEDKETGKKRSKHVVRADHVGPSLKKATAQVQRNVGSDQSQGGNAQHGGNQAQNRGGFSNQQQGANPWGGQPSQGGFSSQEEEPPF